MRLENKEHKICSCFGHKEIEITEKLTKELKSFIEWLITFRKFDVFYFGGLGSFDNLCHKMVSELKLKYPYIKRVYCVPNEGWLNLLKRPSYIKNDEYEEFIYLSLDFNWWYQRIYYRNVEMINKSDFVIFYVKNNENSGAYKALQYAEKQKKEFINFSS